MPRIIKHLAHGPLSVGEKSVCRCGLSKNAPWCDGSHKQTLDEDESKLYIYHADGTRSEVDSSSESQEASVQPN